MGYIKEPAGIDFIVDPAPLTTEDRKKISEIIAYYKATGRKMQMAKSTAKHSRKAGTASLPARKAEKRVA